MEGLAHFLVLPLASGWFLGRVCRAEDNRDPRRFEEDEAELLDELDRL